MTTFDNTIKALEEFDAGNAGRQALWDAVWDAESLDRAEIAEAEALRKVQKAFYEDTKHINRLDNCLLLDISDIRKAVKK